MNSNVRKLLVIFILIMSYIFINLICGNEVFAITQTTSDDINSIDSNQYPQVKEMLQSLKNSHPNWNFKILYTDITWADAIANEYVGHGESPRNLAPANNGNYDDAWKCSVCGTKTYDSGKWHCASEAAIAYMMDARNSLNNSDIFQFMELSYSNCNAELLRPMVKGTFLNNDSCINAILQAAQTHNVNAYYIVARILQEQGAGGSTLSNGQGYNGQYVGYYNVFNIGASGNGKETVILNGLKNAQSKGWTSLESSIIGGTEIIAQSYIKRGQNTLYLQKFDVDNSDGDLYWHQYMQNILAAQKEGETLRKTFNDMGNIEAGYTFIIPVFKNMPNTASPRPSTGSVPTTTDLVKINVTGSLYLRDAAHKNANKIASVYKDEIVTRLEKATQKVDGTYWDYVMKSDGTKGYAARETYESEKTYKLYLVPVNTVTTNVKVDIQSNAATAVPGSTVKDFLNVLGNNAVIKNAKGEVLSSDAKLGTGCVINDTYTVVVLGDVNGDGEVNSGDTLAIKQHIKQVRQIGNESQKVAADINNDGQINSGDSLIAKQHIKNVKLISIK